MMMTREPRMVWIVEVQKRAKAADEKAVKKMLTTTTKMTMTMIMGMTMWMMMKMRRKKKMWLI
jgi:hypothetical protein